MTTAFNNQAKWLELSTTLFNCVEQAYNNSEARVLPSMDNVFRAFSYFPPEETRVIILGQDPYHSVDQCQNPKANGLAFGYNRAYQGRIDSSLENIIAEIGESEHFDTTMESWARQGVLLLNTRLTVEQGEPMSHANKYGYEQAIPELLTNLFNMSKSIEEDRDGIVSVEWGAEARKLVDRLQVQPAIRFSTSHPCKYSHRAGSNPFTGSNVFSKINSVLGRKIVWA